MTEKSLHQKVGAFRTYAAYRARRHQTARVSKCGQQGGVWPDFRGRAEGVLGLSRLGLSDFDRYGDGPAFQPEGVSRSLTLGLRIARSFIGYRHSGVCPARGTVIRIFLSVRCAFFIEID